MEEEQRHEASPRDELSREEEGELARLVESLPFAAFARRQAQYAESKLLQGLKRKLDDLDGALPAAMPLGRGNGEREATRDPGAVFHQLLESSLDQRRNTAEIDLLGHLVEQLSCDEARVLSALSDGQFVPACHVFASSLVGKDSVPILANMSRVGADAGVMLPEYVPNYLTHLLALGLVQTAPEDREAGDRYSMLESEETVREAMRYIEETLRLRPRVQRFSVVITQLGARLCQLGQEAAARG